MQTANQGMEQLLAVNDMETFLKRAEVQVSKKIGGMKFAGMEREDVIQDTLLRVYRNIHRYDSTKAKLNTFLDRIMNSAIKDCLKRASADHNLKLVNAVSLSSPQLSSGSGESDDMTIQVGCKDCGFENFEFLTDLMENLGLTEREKTVFKMRAAGYEPREIATHFGVSTSRVSQIWAHIVAKYEQIR